MTSRTFGVEEEFLLVDPRTGHPVAFGSAVLAMSDTDEVTGELHREMLETATRPCRGLDELGAALRSARSAAAAAARGVGVALAPLASSPLPVEPTVSPSHRYEAMARRFGLTVHENLVCGCHVHVGVASPDEGVAAMDRIRPWLALLLALSTNSPFWFGEDSGHASYRSQMMQRWPSAGPYSPFGTSDGYRALVDVVVATGTVLDEGMIYLDARLSRNYPTVEVRVADVCREPDDAVLIAALTRALVETAVAEWRAGAEPDPVRTEVLRLATWRAARSGIEADLIDPTNWRPAPATDVLDRLVEHVTPALEEAGDLLTVRALLAGVLERGTGARRQRAVHERTGDLAAVARDALRP